MSIMRTALARGTPIWDACAATPFLREMQRGTLSPDRFRVYMIQDSIYLKHYARVYGKAIFCAAAWRDIQTYYEALHFVTDTESAVRRRYLARFGMTDSQAEQVPPLPENRQYIDFLLSAAQRGEPLEMLMAVLPCMLSYSYIFQKLAADPATVQSVYWDFIQDYADGLYADSCKAWCAFADEKCGGLSAGEREPLIRVFERASLLELAFWNMAYREGNP